MKVPSRKGYRGNDCRPTYSPIPPPQVPSFDRIRRFCSLERSGAPGSHRNENATLQMHGHHLPIQSYIPILGDLSAYGVDASCRKRLWDLEIRRLQQLNLSAEEVLKPNIDSNDGLLGGKIESKTFRELKSLANAIRLALFVCIVDDAQQADLDSQTSIFALDCFEVLNRFYRIDDEPPVPGVNPGSKADSWADTLRLPSRDETSTAEQQRARTSFHYLVDQITATIAQIAIKVSESEYWLVVVLACLAKLATKMKVIHSNLHEFIGLSVLSAKSWARTIKSSSSGRRQSALSDDSPIIERHIQEHFLVSSWLSNCITTILRNLGDQKPWWKEDGCIDSCTLIFNAGLTPTRTILHQDNHGGFSGSLDKIAMSFASVALETVWKLGDMITCRTLNANADDDSENQSKPYIKFYLDLEDVFTGKDRRCIPDWPTRLYNIVDYIILVTPLSLTNPIIGEGYRSTIQRISSLSAFGVPNTRQIYIRGFVALKMDKFVVPEPSSKLEDNPAILESESIAKSGSPEQIQCEVSSPLLQSFLLSRRDCLLNRRAIPEPATFDDQGILTRIKFQSRTRNRSREEILTISGNWIIQEKAIVVPCRRYVISVAFLTFVLVAGGMTCAFIVGERIPGVDPFNLTNFSWLVGGLSILIAKSLRVSDWTWRDFLSGQVSCRTVQELSDVTGLNTQHILVFLLSSEMDEILLTGGPFQKAFAKTPEIDGFSIDVKPNLQTLLASGIILVDVVTLDGPALLWLRMIPGHNGPRAVTPSGTGGQGRVCRDPPRVHGSGDAITTFEDSISWIKVVGLYNLRDIEFR